MAAPLARLRWPRAFSRCYENRSPVPWVYAAASTGFGAGDDHGEASTVIVWDVGLSHGIPEFAGAEPVTTAEGNMCGADMRGAVALPASKATSRTNGTRRNLRDLTPPDRKSKRRGCRGRCEESDGCVVPRKPRTNPTTNRRRREWRKGGRSEGRRAAMHAPDREPGSACHRSGEPRGSMCGAWRPRR
jgi:hypothetical protein